MLYEREGLRDEKKIGKNVGSKIRDVAQELQEKKK